MKWTLLTAIFFYSTATAQDTLVNAKAYTSNYLQVPISARATNGNAIAIGIKNSFDVNGVAQPFSIVRVNLNAHTTMTKELAWTTSSTSVLWTNVFDSLGRLHLGLNSGNRTILRLNLKDSIDAVNLGNGFLSGVPLAYSMSLQKDRSMMIGGSSDASSTQFSRYIEDGTFQKFAAIDVDENYVMSIQYQDGWAYVQVGQGTFKYYAFRTSDQYKKQLMTHTTLFNTAAYSTGVYVQKGGGSFPMQVVHDTTLTNQALTGTDVRYTEFNGTGQPTLVSFFDDANGKLFWQLDGVNDSMDVPNSYEVSDIRRVFPDGYDTNFLYYVGDYYGVFYKYQKVTGTRTALGHIGFNVYAAKQVSATGWYISGYPSGVIAYYNSALPWTANTFVNGNNTGLSSTTNPKIIMYSRTQTPSNIHHAEILIQFPNGIIGTSGDEIRTNSTCSMAFYNPATLSKFGLTSDSINSLSYSHMAAWGNKAIMSTNNAYGGTAKLFIYDTELRTLTDSINLGFTNYGKIYIVGDMLIGVASNKLYKVNLSTKQLIYSYTPSFTINQSVWMADGVIGIHKSGAGTVPLEFWRTRAIDNRTYCWGHNYDYFATYGKGIVEYSNLISQTINLNTAEGKQQYLIDALR